MNGMSPTSSGALRPAAHRASVVQHLVHGDRQRVGVAQGHHGEGVAHQDRIDSGGLEGACRGVVVGGEHGDGLAALPLLLQGQDGGLRTGSALGSGGTSAHAASNSPPRRGVVSGQGFTLARAPAAAKGPRVSIARGGRRSRLGCPDRRPSRGPLHRPAAAHRLHGRAGGCRGHLWCRRAWRGAGTRETDLLDPVNTVGQVHAVVLLSGGSAFGPRGRHGRGAGAGGERRGLRHQRRPRADRDGGPSTWSGQRRPARRRGRGSGGPERLGSARRRRKRGRGGRSDRGSSSGRAGPWRAESASPRSACKAARSSPPSSW